MTWTLTASHGKVYLFVRHLNLKQHFADYREKAFTYGGHLLNKLRVVKVENAQVRSLKMLEWMLCIVLHLFVHFCLASSLRIQRKTKQHVLLLLFVQTPVHLNRPTYATVKCVRSPRRLISTMKHWWFHIIIIIHSLTIFKWEMCNIRLNLIYLSFFCSVYFNIFIVK